MKQLTLQVVLLLASCYCFAQTPFTYKIKADSVLITNDSCTAELILENSTKDIKGFLYNRGKGRTEFRSALIQINDTTYVIGDDTLRIFTGGVPANAWQLDGNTATNPPTDFLGTTDNIRLAIKTNNTERMTVLGNGRVLIGTTTDKGRYSLQVNGSIWSNSDALINDILIGRSAGTSSAYNTIIGHDALISNTSGIQHTSVGYETLKSNTTGTTNTAMGYLSMNANTTGNYNTGIGGYALQSNTTGNYNTGIGAFSLQTTTTGTDNTATGYTALNSNTTGSYNSAFGRSALAFNTAGNRNTAVGFGSLNANTIGSSNTAIGDKSLATNTTGDNNTASGFSALTNNTTGYSNTSTGYHALYNNKTGAGNTATGAEALKYDSTGSNNVAAGYLAGKDLTSGDNNIFLGYNTQPNIANNASNQLNIGNWIYGNNGNIGINVTSPTAKAHLAAGTASANTAPLKFTSGSNLTTPENGAVEYDGTNYFATSGGTRYTLAKTLTTTSALNFAATAAQSSSDMTVTVTGAADGDAVSLGVPNSAVSANSAYTAWVSATDTVTIRFNNYSSGSVNPAAGTFRISVIKY